MLQIGHNGSNSEVNEMNKLKSVETKYVSEFESWIWYVNDMMVFETKNQVTTNHFQKSLTKLIDHPVVSIEINDVDTPTIQYRSLNINDISIYFTELDSTKTLRMGSRFQMIFDIPLIHNQIKEETQ